MLANFLKKSTPAHFIYLILLLLAFFVLASYSQFTDGFEVGLGVKKLAFFLGIVFLLLVDMFVIRKNDLTKDSAFALYFAILLLASFSATFENETYLLANIFLLFASRKIYSLKNYKRTIAKVFDAGLWIGVAFLYFEWSLLFMIVLYGGLVNFRLVNWRTLLTPFLGFGTVFVVFYTYHLMFGSLPIFYQAFEFEYVFSLEAFYTVKLALPLFFYIGLAFFSMLVLVPKVLAGSNNFTRSWNTLVLQFLIGAFIMVLTPIKNGASIYFVLLPLPVICTNYMETLNSKWIKNGILYVALLISILTYFL